jgi:hypothetical protein
VILNSRACFAKLIRSRQDFRGEVHNLQNISCKAKSCDGLHDDDLNAIGIWNEGIRLQVWVLRSDGCSAQLSTGNALISQLKPCMSVNQWPYKINATKARIRLQQLDDCSPRYPDNQESEPDECFHFQLLFMDPRNTWIMACWDST